jgi:uncharacterized membrane protein
MLLRTSLVGCVICFAPLSAFADFQDLGELPGGDFFVSQALGVSGDGAVVVGSGSTVIDVPEIGFIVHEQAIRWELGVLTGIESLGTTFERSIARGVSYDGSVVTGNMQGSLGDDGFVWDDEGVMPLGDLPGGSSFSVGRAVSDDGAVIAGSGVDAIADRAIRWDEGVITNLGTGTGSSYAYGVSGDGTTLVGNQQNEGAKRWDGTVMSGLTAPPGDFATRAYGISADGTAIVGRSLQSAGAVAVRWDNGVPELLGILPGYETSVALDASADGSIVVGYSAHPDIPSRAFIWDAVNGIRDLRAVLIARGDDLTGWDLHEAEGISDDGSVIVGTGINPDSLSRGWVAAPELPPTPTPTPTPTPEPGLLLQLVSGLLGLVVLDKRRHRAKGNAGQFETSFKSPSR